MSGTRDGTTSEAGSGARRPRYVSHDGFLMPMGFPVEGFESGLRYRPAPDDVFVASYPKCGTTWTQYLLYLLLHGGEPLASDGKLEHASPHLEEVGREAVAALPSPRLIKTHLPRRLTPWHPRARYVYVARNPFDCAVSFYHHTRGFVRHYDFAEGTFDEFFECFLAGEVDFGDYFANLLPWHAERREANVLFVLYEELHRDLRAAALRIGTFVGGAAAEACSDDRVLARVLEAASFASMSRDQSRWSSARPAGMPPFLRKGTVGDWRSTFSPRQTARLLARFDAATAGGDAAGLWPDIIADARAYAAGA